MKNVIITLVSSLIALPSLLFSGINEGLIGYWPLNGDSLDYSGNDYHGTILDGASFIPNPEGDGLILQTARGGQNYGHVKIPLPDSVNTTNFEAGYEGSGALWVWFDDELSLEHADGWQGILGRPPGLVYLDRRLSGNRLKCMMRRGDGSRFNTWPQSNLQTIPDEGVWYHIAWTLITHNTGETGHLRFYVNGVLASGENDYGILAVRTSIFRIGADYSGRSTNTKLAEVRLYDRVLTVDEITELASGEVGEPEVQVDGALQVNGNIFGQGVIQIGDYASIVDELLNNQAGAIRFNGSTFEGYNGSQWLSFIDDAQTFKLTTPDEMADVVVVSPDTTTTFSGPVIMEQVQGDISMGSFGTGQ